MLHRLLAILLVPFFVVGNSFAHSHDSAAHSSPSPSRTHFHLGDDSHHGHHHRESHGHSHDRHGCDHTHGHRHDHETDESQTVTTTPVDHDSDAIYVAAGDFWFSPPEHGPQASGTYAVVTFVSDYVPIIQPPFRRDLRRHSLAWGPPLYLLHAVLRL